MITIQKSASGAYFTVTDSADGVTRPYLVNDYDFVPSTDGIHFSLLDRFRRIANPHGKPGELVEAEGYGAVILNQPYTNITNGDTSEVFGSFSDLQAYILTNFFRKAGGGSGGGTWGTITGTITDQSDLQKALSVKANNMITPDTLSPTFWCDASDWSQITFDNTLAVSKVSDKSGNGNHFVNTGATNTKPLVVAKDSINGKACVNFDTAIKQLGIASISPAAPYTIYLYIRQTTCTNGNTLVSFGDSVHRITQGVGGNEGGNVINFIGGTNYFPSKKSWFKPGWTLYMFRINEDDTLSCSIDNDPIVNTGQLPGTSISKFVVNGDGSSLGGMSLGEAILFSTAVSDEQHAGLVSYFDQKYTLTPDAPLITWGDSYTLGFNSSDADKLGFARLVADDLSVTTLYNYGVQGGNIGFAQATGLDTNLHDLYDVNPIGTNLSAYMTFCYGTNDGNLGANWGAMYQSMIQYFLDKGFDKNRIVIVTPYATVLSDSDNAAVNATVATVATNLGIRYADCYTAFKNNGGASLMSNGHPNDAGHALMASTIMAALS